MTKLSWWLVLALLAVRTQAANTMSDSPWQLVPIYGGGYVQGVEIAPSDSNVWYSYVDVGGPYRSDDGGKHWYPLHQNFTANQNECRAGEVRSLSIDPRNPDSIVFVAGGRFDSPGGAYVSRDGGQTFRRTLRARFYGGAARRMTGQLLQRDPSNPNRLVTGGDWDGLFVSEDNGESWRSCEGTDEYWFTDIKFDRKNPKRVWACADEFSAWRWGYTGFKAPTERKKGLLRSDDGGRTWRKLSTDTPSELAVAADGGVVIGIFGRYQIMASEDGGDTWQNCMAGLPKMVPIGTPIISRAPNRYQAIVGGKNFILLGAANGDIYRLDNGEKTWKKIHRKQMTLSNPIAESHLANIAKESRMDELAFLYIDPKDEQHWLATDWFGIWETTDGGETWRSRVEGMMQLVCFTVSFDPNNADNMCIGSADMGLHWTTNAGKTWTIADQTVDTTSICYSKKTPNLVYACGGKEITAIVRSTDAGAHWQWMCAPWHWTNKMGIPKVDRKPHGVFFIAVDPTNDDVYVTVSGECGKGKGGVYRSTDKAETWQWCGEGLPVGKRLFKESEFEGEGSFKEELIFGSDGTLIASAPFTGQTFRLNRQAWRWELSAPINNHANLTLAADPFKKGRFLFAGGVLGESIDGAKTFAWKDWRTSSIGTTFAFDAHIPGLLVSVGKDELFVSHDGGRHFSVIDDGLKLPHGNRKLVFLDRGRLFFITEGSGVWWRKIR